MKLRSIKEVKNLKNKKILFRVAYDITLAKKGNGWIVPDNRRIAETIPTIKYLLKNGCSLVFLSWLKRPDGKVVEKLRMDPVARELSKLLGKKVAKVNDCVGEEVKNKIAKLKSGELLMLENVRFHPEEMSGDLKFAKELTEGLDLIVFDAFAQSHRIHSSTTGIMKYLPSYSGLLLDKELVYLEKITKDPKKPLTIILGGAKVSDKINVLRFLSKKADNILIGGGLANAFLKAIGTEIGASYVEDVFVDKAKRAKLDIISESKKIYKNSKNIVLPVDMLSAEKIDPKAKTKVVDLEKGEKIDPNWTFLDIGPKTMKKYSEIIKKSKTILWNGPMGVFEINKFAKGTKEVSSAIISTKAVSVIGGGDTESIVRKYHLEGKFTHVSTGGGAMLEFLEGKVLPAVRPLLIKS
ncbi:MAG: phosphoglycerate kinase [bacterium]